MINPAMMSVVRAFFFILFSPGRFAPRNRGALASCLCCLFLPFRFVATASILARRSARFSVGFRLNACVFRLSKPRLKSQPLGWPGGCRGYILLLLMSCFMHCATF